MLTIKPDLIIKKIFHGDGLKARCARSSVILGIGAFVAKFLGFGSKMILTRLLVPEAMGLMVLILSLTALFEVLTEVGIKQSVIQHKNGSQEEYLNMAWWFQSVRGIGLYAVAFIVSPWICQFYFDKPELLILHSQVEIVMMVRLTFLVFVFNGLLSPRAHVLEKEFKFGKAVLLTQGGAILGSIITIILAFVMRNIWAVIIGFASMGAMKCLLSYIICPFMPRLSFDLASFKNISRFARGMLGLPVLTYIAFNIDVLVAGKLISADLVGMYGMALVLARTPQDLFSRIISPILLPAFAEKQDNKSALCNAVLKITKITILLTFPLVTLAIIFSRDLLSFAYGEQYSIVAVSFALLCAYALLLIQGIVLANVFLGIGEPSKHRIFVGFRALILIVFIYPATVFFGLTGVAAIVLLANFFALCLQVVVIRKLIGLSILHYFKCWLDGIILSLPVLIIVVFLRIISPDLTILQLAAGVFTCFIFCPIGLLTVRNNSIVNK